MLVIVMGCLVVWWLLVLSLAARVYKDCYEAPSVHSPPLLPPPSLPVCLAQRPGL